MSIINRFCQRSLGRGVCQILPATIRSLEMDIMAALLFVYEQVKAISVAPPASRRREKAFTYCSKT